MKLDLVVYILVFLTLAVIYYDRYKHNKAGNNLEVCIFTLVMGFMTTIYYGITYYGWFKNW